MKTNFSIGSKITVLIIRFIMWALLIVFMLYGSLNASSAFLKPIIVLIGIHLISQLIVFFMRERFLFKPYVQMLVFVFDVIVLSAAIYLTQGFNQDLYLIYFLTIFMASIARSTVQALMASFISALFYIGVTYFITGTPEKIEPIVLLRVPFLFLTALSSHYFAAKLGRKHDELETLEQTGRLFESRIIKLLDTMSSGTIIADNDFNVIRMNAEAEIYFKIKDENAIGRNIAEITHGFTPEIPWKELKSKRMPMIRFDLRRDDKEPSHLSVLLSKPPEGVKKGPVSQIMIIENMSRHKENTDFKKDFLQTISRSFSKPIASIIKYTEYIGNDSSILAKIDENSKSLIHSIHEKAFQLSNISAKLEKLSLIEAGTLNLKREDIALTQLINDCSHSLKSMPGFPAFKLNIDDSLANIPPLSIDRDSITEVIVNIIENAVKFNDKPEKEVWVRSNNMNMVSSNQIEIEISDNGKGIPVNLQNKIFNKPITYTRNEVAPNAGTGIGLFICKKLIELNSGKIRFESAPNKGTKFILTLPLSLAIGKNV
ncbi:MAG: hypothetical protein A3J83_05810 [Elusimicrobia bacterium RIFOXYA2_FULL_40_6]|nr:MAG: hypothetical protein A3J83_05810 [Elusimicrobia bacterium RIFOXYA2_FULL_40_6]